MFRAYHYDTLGTNQAVCVLVVIFATEQSILYVHNTYQMHIIISMVYYIYVFNEYFRSRDRLRWMLSKLNSFDCSRRRRGKSL